MSIIDLDDVLTIKHDTAIAWTHRPGTKGVTWNPVSGCSWVSKGCDNCYAQRLINTRMSKNHKSARFGHLFHEVMLHGDRLSKPLGWKTPRTIFVNSLSDLFHAFVPDDFIEQVWNVMRACEGRHTFQILTKRPERMRRVVADIYRKWGLESGSEHSYPPLTNVWLGVSVEDNDAAWRVRWLRETAAAIRFLSIEPQISAVDRVDFSGMNWVIAGGESGPGSRPLHPKWARDVRDRCVSGGIAFFFKQWGEFAPRGALVDGQRLPIDNDRTIIVNESGLTRGRLSGSLTNALATFSDGSWCEVMERVGKSASGSLLDGRAWTQQPA